MLLRFIAVTLDRFCRMTDYLVQVFLDFFFFYQWSVLESLAGREAAAATSPLHPINQRCWFHGSHESAHSAGLSCRLSPYEAL